MSGPASSLPGQVQLEVLERQASMLRALVDTYTSQAQALNKSDDIFSNLFAASTFAVHADRVTANAFAGLVLILQCDLEKLEVLKSDCARRLFEAARVVDGSANQPICLDESDE